MPRDQYLTTNLSSASVGEFSDKPICVLSVQERRESRANDVLPLQDGAKAHGNGLEQTSVDSPKVLNWPIRNENSARDINTRSSQSNEVPIQKAKILIEPMTVRQDITIREWNRSCVAAIHQISLDAYKCVILQLGGPYEDKLC